MINPTEIVDLLVEQVNEADAELTKLRSILVPKRAEKDRIIALTATRDSLQRTIGLISQRSRAGDATSGPDKVTGPTQFDPIAIVMDVLPPELVAKGREVAMRVLSDLFRPPEPPTTA